MRPTGLTWCLRVGMVFVVIAACLAWIAAGQIGDATSRGLEQTNIAIDDAILLADSTAKIAEQVQATVISVALGMNSASEAIGNTVTVSENIRKLLGYLSILNRVDDLKNSLSDVEASLQEGQGGLVETKDNLIAAEPAIANAVTVLESVPDQLRDANDKIGAAGDRIDDYVKLSRVMIVLLTMALLLLFFAVERMSRRPRLAGDQTPGSQAPGDQP